MTDAPAAIEAAQAEACEAQADQLEHDWFQIQADTSLSEALAADRPELLDPQARQAWRIEGDNTAVWALRKLAAAQEERDRIRRAAQAEIDRIRQWAADAERPVERSISFFTGKLIDYRRDLEEQNPNLPKTYKLPAGDIAVRAGRTSVKVVDESAFVDWAVDHAPQALTYKPKVSGLKDLPRSGERIIDPATGDGIPGVVEITADPTYTVKPAAPEEPF